MTETAEQRIDRARSLRKAARELEIYAIDALHGSGIEDRVEKPERSWWLKRWIPQRGAESVKLPPEVVKEFRIWANDRWRELDAEADRLMESVEVRDDEF